MLSDTEILSAYRLVAETEGIFCEPASAISVAGVIKKAASGLLRGGEVVVCTLTGHGLKDPDTALSQVGEVTKVPASLERLAEILEVG